MIPNTSPEITALLVKAYQQTLTEQTVTTEGALEFFLSIINKWPAEIRHQVAKKMLEILQYSNHDSMSKEEKTIVVYATVTVGLKLLQDLRKQHQAADPSLN